MVIFTIFQKNGLLVEIGHFEAFPANFGVTDLTLGDSRVAPKGFFLLYYPYPVPKLLAETFFGLGPDLVHLTNRRTNPLMNDIIFAKYMTVALRNQSKLPTTIKMRVTKK